MSALPAERAVTPPRKDHVSVGEHVLALLGGDFSRGLAGFAEDVVWHVPEGGELGGEHRGREAVLALIERLFAPSPHPSRVAFRSLVDHDGYRVEWVELRAPSGRAMEHPVVSRSESGRIREVWWCGKRA